MATWILQGRHELDPDQDFIATARNHGLFTIWAHPGTRSGMRTESLGVKVATRPYSDKIFNGPYADAFAAVYGDTDSNCDPGGPWDQYMKQYLEGVKDRPVWAVSAGDFHYQGGFGTYLGDFPMDVWTRDRSPQGVLDALRGGHNANWQQPKERNIHIRTLALIDGRKGAMRAYLPGATAKGAGPFFLALAADALPMDRGDPPTFTLQVVVDGLVTAMPQLKVNAGKIELIRLHLAPGNHLVRVRIPPQQGFRLEANPFFIRVRSRPGGRA